MKRFYIKGLTHFLAIVFLLFATTPAVTIAQDTQLYIGDLESAGVKHNLLFILDTSFSMRREVLGSGDVLPNGTLGPDKTRIAILKEVMDSTILGLDNLNVGYMRMNGARSAATRNPRTAALACTDASLDADLIAAGGQNQGDSTRSSGPDANNLCYIPTGGNVLFPVTDLDQAANTIEGFSNNISVSVSSSAGDAQHVDGSILDVLDDPILDIGNQNQCTTTPTTLTVSLASGADDVLDQVSDRASILSRLFRNNLITRLGRTSNNSVTHRWAFRFQDIAIPSQDAIILSANITFGVNPRVVGSAEELDVPIYALPPGEEVAFDASLSASRISTLMRHIPLPTEDTTVLLWEVPPTGDNSVTSMVTTDLSSVVNEWLQHDDWVTGDSIVLVAGPSIDGANHPGRAFRSHEVFLDNPTGISPTTLTIEYCPTLEFVRSQVGLRFEAPIPQGAEIASAFIGLIPASTHLNSEDGTTDGNFVTIRGHNVDDSDAFDTSNISAHSPVTAASQQWMGSELSEWVEGALEYTEDIAPIVQEIVNRSGWCGGNGMSFIIAGAASTVGSLSRRVYSSDAGSALVPVLDITYTVGTDPEDTSCIHRNIELPLAQANHSASQLRGAGELTNAAETNLNVGEDALIGMIFELPLGPSVFGSASITIESAELEFYTRGSSNSFTGGSDVNIYVQEGTDPLAFMNGTGRLDATNRPRLAGGPVVLDGSELVTVAGGTTAITTDVTSLVSAVIAQSGWQADNNIVFLLEGQGVSGVLHTVLNFANGVSTNEQPKLRISYRETGAPDVTVRDTLLSINESFQIPNLLAFTPSVETLFEAALYWRGKEMNFGKTRGVAGLGIQNVFFRPGIQPRRTVDYTEWMHRTNTSHPGSYTGGQYNEPPDYAGGQSCLFLHTPECAQDSVTGEPIYISPIGSAAGSCAQNFQIFLTDGRPTWANDATEELIKAEFPSITSCSVDPAINAREANGRCAVEMLRVMSAEDQRPSVPGDQTIETHIIAFNLDEPVVVVDDIIQPTWLEQLATAGRGNNYQANNTAQLQTVFNTILGGILQEPRAFTSPAISANSFNRLFSRDETYFGLFEAQATPRWAGNLKKYNICTSTAPDAAGVACTLGDVLDSQNMPAVDNAAFSATSRSVWSTETDGGVLRAGGAGAELDEPSERTIYTELGNSLETTTARLNTTGHVITSDNWVANLYHIHSQVCPALAVDSDNPPSLGILQAGTDSCEDRMLWMLGQDIRDEDGDGDTTDLRWWFPDILHSSPTVITYGIDDQNTPADPTDDRFIDKIVVGTNGGGIHMINGEDGEEDWVFIPNELFANQPRLYDDSGIENIYGMDLTPVIRVIDTDRNGIIDPSASVGDRVYGYFGMRRGGNSYYALNLTPPAVLNSTTDSFVPRWLWSITSGGSTAAPATNFSRLGQTWSEPVVASIRCQANTHCSGGRETVLIFGGGYDTGLDDNFGLAAGRPNRGNAIYIVDADTGEIIFWIGHAEIPAAGAVAAVAASGADIEVPDMFYSIVVQPTVLDSDSDGLMDRIYVGDLAGQVWRIDLAADINIGGSSPEGDTVVGRLANISDPTVEANQRRFHYAPAVVQVLDHVYSADAEYDYVVITSGDRANPLGTTVQDRLYAFRDYQTTPMAGSSGLATGYPLNAAGTSSGSIKEEDLTDVTTRVLLDAVDADLTSIQDSHGWFLDFTRDGQKGLSTPIVISGNVLLTSYIPYDSDEDAAQAIASCSASEGSGVAHNLNILTTVATQDWDGDDATPVHPVDSRSSTLGGGIPSAVIPIFTREGVTLSVGTGRGPRNLGVITGVPRTRSYWTEDAPTF